MKSHKMLFALAALTTFHTANAQNITLTATSSTRSSSATLPAMPRDLPRWLDTEDNHEVFYKRAAYNFAIYDIPALARDMNGVAVGHSLAYEALVTGRANQLETEVWNDIDHVLKNPPRLMPTEKALSPTFAQKYGALETVFDWTHVSHAQTIDNFVSRQADNAQKDRETELVWNYYKTANAPFVVTGLPMNMAWLDSQPYSGAFRQKYPKVNALFWGYHWLQTSIYDGLRAKNLSEQKKMYAMLGGRYHDVELYDIKRAFMPMMAETSPLFSARYPEIANAFDNLHMLHDMVNDILASDWMSEAQKRAQIKRAIWIMSPDAHKSCKAGENRGVVDGVSHDHRFMDGMPGMGMMKNGLESTVNPVADAPKADDSAPRASVDMSDMNMEHGAMMKMSAISSTRYSVGAVETRVSAHLSADGKDNDADASDEPAKAEPKSGSPKSGSPKSGSPKSESSKSESDATAFNPTELMWMPKMGWMNMSQCHHCSMPLPDGGSGAEAWRASTVSAEGWTMRVRCALCARDMSGEVKGGAILSLSTENPNVRVTVFADEKGNFSTESKGVVFLEEKGSHARCSQWSQAFTSRLAFDDFVKANPKYADAKALTFDEWASREATKPETYYKEEGPVENPYAADLKKRGIEATDEHADMPKAAVAKADELSDDEAALANLSVADDANATDASATVAGGKADKTSAEAKE